MNDKKVDVYQKITDIITAKLSQGVAPWRCVFTQYGLPKNYASGREYRGINSMLLGITGKTPYYLTYLQAKELGGHVKRGSHGFSVIFWKMIDSKEETSGEPEKRPFLKYYTVFSIDDIEGINFELPEKFGNQVISSCQDLLSNMTEKPTIITESGKAYYNKTQDFIAIPPIEDFESSETYYQVYFHELIHWTGHSSRLNRVFDAKCSENYSKEELIAEIGSSFLCAKLGIKADYDNSASYIQNWLRNLQNDKKYIIDAASKAQKAVDYILNLNVQEESEN